MVWMLVICKLSGAFDLIYCCYWFARVVLGCVAACTCFTEFCCFCCFIGIVIVDAGWGFVVMRGCMLG